MTPERWTQVEQLFDAVADLPPTPAPPSLAPPIPPSATKFSPSSPPTPKPPPPSPPSSLGASLDRTETAGGVRPTLPLE